MKRAFPSLLARRFGGDQPSTPRAMLAAIAGAAAADLTYNALRG